MTKADDLNAYLFEGQKRSEGDAISGELLGWMDASARFTAFIETYRDKIRKKLRLARDPESLLDVRSELAAAYCLLADRRLDIQYEPYMSTGRRGADFAVTYRVNLAFNLEVARIRDEARERDEQRLAGILLNKLGQLQPGMPNLLVICAWESLVREIDLGSFVLGIKARAEGKDAAFFAAGRYASPLAFFKDFNRLNAVLLGLPGASWQVWINKGARPTLEEKVIRLVASLMAG